MDADTTGSKDGHGKILRQFEAHEADILVGTQMIAKGHDFANVTLVGVIAADTSLHMDDYRVNEITFQLLTQVNGRAGRHKEGISVLQTYAPENYSIQCAVTEDYATFYKEEIAFRKMAFYPPFAKMLTLMLKCTDEAILNQSVKEVQKRIRDFVAERQSDQEKLPELSVVGPTKPYVYKLMDVYQLGFTIKTERLSDLYQLMDLLLPLQERFKTLQMNMDLIK